uniref:Uncharacterized protein n=1 Tax=Ditylenchus dipsaci TaxID=166011 RepID=A0A915DPC4_9BILA
MSSVKFPIGTGNMDINQPVEIEVVPMYKDKKCSKTIHHKPIRLVKSQKVIRLGVCDFEKGTCGGKPTFEAPAKQEEENNNQHRRINKNSNGKMKEANKIKKTEKNGQNKKKKLKKQKKQKGKNEKQEQEQSKEKTVNVHGYGFCAAQSNHVQSFVVTVKQDVYPTGKLSKNQKKSGRHQKTLFHHTKTYNTHTGKAGTNFLLGKATLDSSKPVLITVEPRYKDKVAEKCHQKIEKVIQPHEIIKGSINLGVCDFEEHKCHGQSQGINKKSEKTDAKSEKDKDVKSKNSKGNKKEQKKGNEKVSLKFEGHGFCPNSSEHVFTITVKQGGRTVLQSKEGIPLGDATRRQSSKVRRVKRAAGLQKTKSQ